MDAIDALLTRSVERGDVAGVVAAAATARDVVYQGAFGTRDPASGAPMRADTPFRIASLTKAVTSVAAMQLVERGALELDAPVAGRLPRLAEVPVLEGFDAEGAPRLRPAASPITLRQLLTHTSGFGYEIWNADLARCVRSGALPSLTGGGAGFLDAPLVCDPGSRWEYGIGTDWVGRLVEVASGESLDAYFRRHLLGPLGLRDTGFALPAADGARLAAVCERRPDAGLTRRAIPDSPPSFFSGGGGLHGTAPDYLRFLRALLGRGALDGARLLEPETLAEMARHQIGGLASGAMPTAMPELSHDFAFFPRAGFGLGFCLNLEPLEGGRAAGSLAWAGAFNCYYWVDLERDVAGVLFTQLLPFFDPRVRSLFADFERAVYARLG